MNTNYDLQLTATATYKGQEIDFSFDPYNDCADLDGLKELAISEIAESPDFGVEADGINEKEVTVQITDFEGIPEKWANEKDVWDFAEAFAENEQEIEVIEAALNCGVEASNIDEAYQGQYKDDEDFAQEMAESLGAIDKNAAWPMNCIDWEYAAKELMYDYMSDNGYYFRSL